MKMKTQKKEEDPLARTVIRQLVDVGGAIAQDFGFSRIAGQVMVYLFLSEGERSLDEIGESLGLSKPAVSVASRQLEGLGLIRRVFGNGGRKRYYRSADDLGTALHQGILILVRNRLSMLGSELQKALEQLPEKDRHDLEFLRSRVNRAESLRKTISQLMESPIVKLLSFVKGLG